MVLCLPTPPVSSPVAPNLEIAAARDDDSAAANGENDDANGNEGRAAVAAVAAAGTPATAADEVSSPLAAAAAAACAGTRAPITSQHAALDPSANAGPTRPPPAAAAAASAAVAVVATAEAPAAVLEATPSTLAPRPPPAPTAAAAASRAAPSRPATCLCTSDAARLATTRAAARPIRGSWVGTGVMGAAMCGHLQAAGYAVNVFNRTPSKAEELVVGGAVLCESPAAVAAISDVVFSIVGYPHDVQQVVLGPTGVLSALKPGGILVDMSTSQPSLAREIAAAAEARQCWAVDAPVSGGDKGAREAALAIMAGGDEAVVQALQPLLSCMGKCTYMGPAGAGQSCKMANQVTIASTMVGLVEGLLYAHKAGLHIPT
ncbi:unnamed protein product [Closterium sp. Naga37s-1]|nr:unnamed protein product [Closterium sp. Naga37s-1]